MLRLRVVTALILVALLVPAIFFLDQRAWAVLVAFISGVAAWEYARLSRFCQSGQIVFGVLIFLTGFFLTFLLEDKDIPALVFITAPFSVFFWLLLAPCWLRYRWVLNNHILIALVGFVLFIPTWSALVFIRTLSPWWLLLVLCMVALADIAAYFSGRRFGQRKLAPNISPGKTWEGAWGAMLAVTVAGCGLLFFYGKPVSLGMMVFALFALPLLTLLSIAGDLFESLLKRQAGVKDSSNLLPGHGGVLDRIDSYISSLPLVALFIQFI